LATPEPEQTQQRRRAPTPSQAWPSQEADQSPIFSPTSLQPNKPPQVVLHVSHRTLPSWTIIETASKLDHNISNTNSINKVSWRLMRHVSSCYPAFQLRKLWIIETLPMSVLGFFDVTIGRSKHHQRRSSSKPTKVDKSRSCQDNIAILMDSHHCISCQSPL
jgi:hypothetical protein